MVPQFLALTRYEFIILHRKGNITMRPLNVDAFYDACLLTFSCLLAF